MAVDLISIMKMWLVQFQFVLVLIMNTNLRKNVCLSIKMMLVETSAHDDSSIGFAVIHLDETGCVAQHFYLDEKFLGNDDLIDQIKFSLELMI